MLCSKKIPFICNYFIHRRIVLQCMQNYVTHKKFLLPSAIEFSRSKSTLKKPKTSQVNAASCNNLSYVSHNSDSFICNPVSDALDKEILNTSPPITDNQLEEEEYLCQGLLSVLQQGLLLEDLTATDLSLVTERFGLKGLNIDYIYEYGIKLSSDLKSLMFPYDSLNKEFSAIQLMSYDQSSNQNIVSLTSSIPSKDMLFGWSSVGFSKKEIIIVSDPLDAVAVNQETDLPVVSLSCDFAQFSSELITLLKVFQKVTFWLKPDFHGIEIHHLLGQSLRKSAFFIRPQDHPCALMCLQSNLRLRHILNEADPLYHEGVDRVSSYRTVLFERFRNHEKYSGVKWKRFSALNDILQGHRKRELTIFSGQTGTGKTTLVSEYSLDLCMQGLPTLWASFEISNERLLETMLCQYAECSLVENSDKFHCWFDKFESLPMYILNCHGRTSLKGMLQALKTYVRAYNVQHVVIDNLQFLMNIENYGSTIDQYRRQDEIFGAFRGFATRCDCHVTIVIHPRKEPEFSELNNASISGTAKATQEADNILILQTTKTRQYLHVTKNRYAGVKGCIIVEFDRKSQTFKQKKNSMLDNQEQKKLL